MWRQLSAVETQGKRSMLHGEGVITLPDRFHGLVGVRLGQRRGILRRKSRRVDFSSSAS
jgi:hypothetical protein